MALWRPDPTFYPTPRAAAKAPPEELAYVVFLNADRSQPDAIQVVDVNPASSTYGQVVGQAPMPYAGGELHHFGWNACSSMLCPGAPHPHLERRYLVVPDIKTSHIAILDTRPDPTRPQVVKVIPPEELHERTGYSRPHTVHCGPEGIYISALGGPEGQGPGGILILDHETFEPLGRWEIDRGGQYLHYDFWWHLGYDVLLSSEWGTPEMVEGGVLGEALLQGQYGRRLHLWDLQGRRLLQTLDLGPENQMVLELRPAHDPTRAYGFVNVVLSLKDLSSSIWLWYRQNGSWQVRKVIEIPAEPAEAEALPEILRPFGAVPPLVTDIALSVDDRFLYVACWGTGELRQYEVSDPFRPRLTGRLEIGGILRKAGHPQAPGPLNGGPQMVEVSRDGRRVYFTNSLYLPWDAQFYPEGIRGFMAKALAHPEGGLAWDEGFFLDLGPHRAHQIRLQGGDASSDSYCFP
ncbi:selenium-binding protein SBP56-related protein [Thermus thermamylovorans]|uniref:Methanethiol oxidase n=1 Tax=Thermus thermamylovorans TaxID=2509362 RepID=A0A4V6MRG5_9DEIN|nr:selenium-binding protein SBP56-related protein [Thermus thermamylovorans]TBH20944.1 selenium-binding protein [Thermus thermamylovorans]